MRDEGKALEWHCMLLHFTALFLPVPSFFPFIMYIFYLSSQPDGSPDHVTSVSVIEPGMRLPPVYVGGQSYYILV